MGNALLERLGAAAQEVHPQQLLQSFPRIAERIAELWGRREIEAYFEDLMIDRRGNRQGFPSAVLMDILRLRTYHRSMHPPVVRTVDTWADLLDTVETEAQGATSGRMQEMHLATVQVPVQDIRSR